MCVVAFAYDCHPRWRLLLIGNRDEYHARASAPLACWSDAPHVVGGRDLVSGGSWLGVSDEGRVAVVTNVRNPDGPDPMKESRGALVADWLIAGVAPPVELLDGYNGFSLIVADLHGAQFITNRPDARINAMPAGVHSLSNGTVDAPWPRRENLEAALSCWLNETAADPTALFALLRPASDDGIEPIFINAPVYGTRCSTIVAIDRAGQGWISERRFDEAGLQIGTTALEFAWGQ
jgi:uncharacterized protein with NRDE domain